MTVRCQLWHHMQCGVVWWSLKCLLVMSHPLNGSLCYESGCDFGGCGRKASVTQGKKNPYNVGNFSSNTRMVRAAIVEGSALCVESAWGVRLARWRGGLALESKGILLTCAYMDVLSSRYPIIVMLSTGLGYKYYISNYYVTWIRKQLVCQLSPHLARTPHISVKGRANYFCTSLSQW